MAEEIICISSPSGHDDPWRPCIITTRADVLPRRIERLFDLSSLLAVSHLERQPTGGAQDAQGLREEPAKEIEPIRTTIERSARLEFRDLGLELVDLSRGNVREVRHDEIDGSANPFEEIPGRDAKPFDQFVRLRVRRGNFCCAMVHIYGEHIEVGALFEEREGDATATRADVYRSVHPFGGDQLERLLDQHLCLGPRNQNMSIDSERERPKLLLTGKVSHGLPEAPPLDELAIRRALVRVEGTAEIEEKTESIRFQRVSQQNLRVESRRVDSTLGQIFCRPVENASNGPEVHRSPVRSTA